MQRGKSRSYRRSGRGKENAISSRYKALQLDSRVNIVSISLSFETSERASDSQGRKERGLGRESRYRGMRSESARLHPRDASSSFRGRRSYRTFREIDERWRSSVCNNNFVTHKRSRPELCGFPSSVLTRCIRPVCSVRPTDRPENCRIKHSCNF